MKKKKKRTTGQTYPTSNFRLKRMTVRELVKIVSEKGINLSPPMYQRNFVASLRWMQQFIDSAYHHRSTNLFHVRELPAKYLQMCGYLFEVIDGCQRLSTVLAFVRNEFPDKNGRFYKDLPIHLRKQFESYTIDLYVYDSTMTDTEACATFTRINNGTTLNKPEILNAISGAVSQEVRNAARGEDVLPLFKTVKSVSVNGKQNILNAYGLGVKPGNRMLYDYIVAGWLVTEYLADTNSKSYRDYKEMRRMYENDAVRYELGPDRLPVRLAGGAYAVPEPLRRYMKHVRANATLIFKWLSVKRNAHMRACNTRGKLNLLYDLARTLEATYGKGCVKDPDLLLRGVHRLTSAYISKDAAHKSLYNSLLSSDNPVDIETKLKIYMEPIDQNRSAYGIVPMDHTAVSLTDRQLALAKQGYRCAIDEQPLDLEEAEAAHIVAKALGGTATPDNLVMVRKVHNQRMGQLTPRQYKELYFPHLCQKSKKSKKTVMLQPQTSKSGKELSAV